VGSGRSWRLSEEQNLDLRTIAGGGLTFDAFRSDRLHLRLIGGIVWNNERYQAGATAIPRENGPEVLTGLYLSWFQFRQWNVDSALSSPKHFNSRAFSHGRDHKPQIPAHSRAEPLVELEPDRKLGQSAVRHLPPADYVTTTSISWAFP